MARWGGAADDWVDLSTGINPRPYPLPAIPVRSWASLPTRTAMAALCDAARAAYGAGEAILPVAGAQAAIQMIPRACDFSPTCSSVPSPRARVLGPTYNEHAASFEAAGWRVDTVTDPEALARADVAVVVNPNNPDGRVLDRDVLRDLAGRVGLLIVDESFADPCPEVSLSGEARGNILVLRSFGKFYGLAGLRLGFALGSVDRIAALSSLAGPWPVSGPAIDVGVRALADRAWQMATTARLDGLAARAGWTLAGGSALFQLYETPDAEAAQRRLAGHRVWSRVFPYSERWIRLGLPDGPAAWDRLEAAF